MSKLALDNLFGSKTRVKVLKFLFRNYPNPFTLNELSQRTQESFELIKREIDILESIGLIKKYFAKN